MQAYQQIDQQLHQLSQILAKVNKAYVSAREDDSHTNLYYSPIHDRIFGRWITINDQRYIFSLSLKNECFAVLTSKLAIAESFPLKGQAPAQLTATIAKYLDKEGLDTELFLAPLHYDIPGYPSAQQAFTRFDPSALATWRAFRSLANATSYRLMSYLQTFGECRIWPHHFDTGIYLEPSSQVGLGFGLAMSDEMVGAPYFYLSGYGLAGKPVGYHQLMALATGSWKITERWQGAVLPLPALASLSPAEQQALLDQFIAQASQAIFKQF